jgi:hypothetical protein
MKFSAVIALIVGTLALAACNRPDTRPAGTGSSADRTPAATQTQNTPANLPAPSETERRRENDHPQQGQVDTKEPSQQRDFQRN